MAAIRGLFMWGLERMGKIGTENTYIKFKMAVTNHKTRFGGPLSFTRWPKVQLRSGLKRLLWVELLELTTKCIVVLQWCIGGMCGDNGRPRINGTWSQWALYSSCTRSCGGGVHYRTRLCTNPAYVFKFIRVAKSLPKLLSFAQAGALLSQD